MVQNIMSKYKKVSENEIKCIHNTTLTLYRVFQTLFCMYRLLPLVLSPKKSGKLFLTFLIAPKEPFLGGGG